MEVNSGEVFVSSLLWCFHGDRHYLRGIFLGLMQDANTVLQLWKPVLGRQSMPQGITAYSCSPLAFVTQLIETLVIYRNGLSLIPARGWTFTY